MMQLLRAIVPVFTILQLGIAQRCSNCNTGIAVMTQGELRKEIRAELAAALGKNGSCVASIKNQEQRIVAAVTELVEQAVANISSNIDQLVAPLVTRLNRLHLPGKTPSHPAISCKEIRQLKPSAPSGHYWIRASDGSAVHKYCDMTRTCGGVTGGWMQVASIDMTNSSQQCPTGLKTITKSSKRLCGINTSGVGCSSAIFQTHGIEYTHVCGKVIGYQDGSPDAFGHSQRRDNTIDGNYVDGVSITHGHGPRKHIWTFVTAHSEATGALYPTVICPCTDDRITPSQLLPIPSFIGNDYFCDTGSDTYAKYIFYPNDPLWDGQGCGPHNTCCAFNNPPLFSKVLSSTASDDIELRICSDENHTNEDIPLEIIELFVQ